MALNAQTALVFQALATGPEGEVATYGHRAILLRASVPERMAWCSAAEALIRDAPNRLTIPELAFTLLGTLHRLADPTGIRWGRMLAEQAG
jgi:hypothetical protein